MPPEGSSAGPAADADDMGATSPAYPTPAVTATQPGDGAEQEGHTETPARRYRASPGARKLAGEFGIDVTSLAGSGPMGRIIIADVVAAQDRAIAEAPPTPQPVLAPQPSTRRRAPRPTNSRWFPSEAPASSRRSGRMRPSPTALS